MSNITSQNNIRYQIDTLNTTHTGVISGNNVLNFTRADKVSKITVNGTQPSGTARYIAFCINGIWGKLTPSGTFSPFTSNTASYTNLEEHANTPQELEALTDIPALAGKSCGTAIALMSTDPDNILPACSLSFTCSANGQQLTAIEYSPVYDLGAESQIVSLTSQTAATNGGSAALQARITKPDGSLSEWGALDSFSGVKAQAVQFMGTYKAQSVGVSSAKIENASVIYSDGKSITSGVSDGEIISLTEDWYMPVKSCRLTVKHSPLEQSTIKAYIAFRKSPTQVKAENLGIGTGGRKTYQLQNTGGLKYDTLKLYYDNMRVYTDYEFNCEAGRVTCAAPEGVIVSCDYEYGWESEEWQEMSLSSRLSYEDYDQSEYRYSGSSEGLSVCALKMILSTTSGHINGERLGTSTGRVQSFKLSRRINDGKINVYASGNILSGKNFTLLDDPQYISVNVSAGKIILADYDWISETPEVYEYYAVYSE